jgi:hypothetical protein
MAQAQTVRTHATRSVLAGNTPASGNVDTDMVDDSTHNEQIAPSRQTRTIAGQKFPNQGYSLLLYSIFIRMLPIVRLACFGGYIS